MSLLCSIFTMIGDISNQLPLSLEKRHTAERTNQIEGYNHIYNCNISYYKLSQFHKRKNQHFTVY